MLPGFRTLVAALLPAAASASVFNLSNLKWTLKNENGSVVVPGSVPSQVHLDLLSAGVITEPLLGINGANALFLLKSESLLPLHRFHSAMDNER